MYLKVTNLEENHHGLQYMDGINVDPIPFAREGTCVPGGIYFTTEKYICWFIYMGIYVREVTIPEDAEMVEDPNGDKWRASKVILGERRDLRKGDTWEWLVENGVDIQNSRSEILRYVSIGGYLDAIKYLVKYGFDIHCEDGACFRIAAWKGNLKLVKYLVENGADIKAGENEAFRFAAYYGHIDVVKYLVEKGAIIDEWAMGDVSGVVRDYLLTKIEVAIYNCSQPSNGK